MTDINHKKEKAPRECLCGCGSTTKGGRYAPGHDAKHKKVLIDAALAGSKRSANTLEKLGWSKFLEAKREKLAKAVDVRPVVASESSGEGDPRRRGGRRKRTDEAVPEEVEADASEQTGAKAAIPEAGEATPAN